MSQITDNAAEERFETATDGGTAFLSYRVEDGALFLLHTEVPPEDEGNGIGSRLAHHALEQASARGMTVVPLCPFVDAYLRRHPALAERKRAADG